MHLSYLYSLIARMHALEYFNVSCVCLSTHMITHLIIGFYEGCLSHIVSVSGTPGLFLVRELYAFSLCSVYHC